MEHCVTSGDSLFQVFRHWKMAKNGKIEPRQKKQKKGREREREEGFFPLSAYSQRFFVCLLFCALSQLSGYLKQVFLTLTDSRFGHTKEWHHECFKVMRLDEQTFFLRIERKFCINWYVIAPRVFSWHLVETVGLLSARLFTMWQIQLVNQ